MVFKSIQEHSFKSIQNRLSISFEVLFDLFLESTGYAIFEQTNLELVERTFCKGTCRKLPTWNSF